LKQRERETKYDVEEDLDIWEQSNPRSRLEEEEFLKKKCKCYGKVCKVIVDLEDLPII
jgi:hypothetical protein